jgi:hypothetical protein
MPTEDTGGEPGHVTLIGDTAHLARQAADSARSAGVRGSTIFWKSVHGVALCGSLQTLWHIPVNGALTFLKTVQGLFAPRSGIAGEQWRCDDGFRSVSGRPGPAASSA